MYVSQIDTSFKFGTEQGFDKLSTILVSTSKICGLINLKWPPKWPPSRNENFKTLQIKVTKNHIIPRLGGICFVQSQGHPKKSFSRSNMT